MSQPADRPFPDPPATLPAALARAARHFPDTGIRLWDGRGRRSERRTFPELVASVEGAAGRWRAAGVEPGDRVLISVPTSWEWLEGWLGAVKLGALPVAVAPPGGFGAAGAHIRKVEYLVERLGARRVLSTEGFRRDAAAAQAKGILETLITPEELAGLVPASGGFPEAEPEAVAFLQLTSGSTGFPRAVMIRHRGAIHNALANDVAIGAAGGGDLHGWCDALIGWLPLHHDMGLVGYLLLSLCTGIELELMRPTTFLARPRVFLDRFGSYRAAVAHGPSSGYQLCVERLATEARHGLSLGGWRAAQCGAEMIRPETVAGFVDAFGPLGFHPEAFQACYGLAEATLTVSFDTRGRGARTRPVPEGSSISGLGLHEVVCLGPPVIDTSIRIVDALGQTLPDGSVGSVEVEGPGIFAGYWDDPEATAESLVDGRLRTGDLGFLADGELYLTGRTKDLLIIRGHNVMPHEIEWVAEQVTGGGGAHRSGAFSVARSAQGEEAVLVVEIATRDGEVLGQIERDIRTRVANDLSLQISDLVFVRRGKIPKTTSGKVRRRKLRDQYLGGELERL